MLLTNSFISEISLSTSSMNWIMKSTSLCFNISSVWKFVIRKEMSYPYSDGQSPPWSGVSRSPTGQQPAQSRSAELPFQPRTLIGFRLRIKNDSARCSKNRVNLCTRMCSISSACLILRLIRTLLMLGSMRTRSFSLRAIVNGVRRTSGDVRASTSGTLCRSAVWDAKLDRQRAAVRLLRTA